MHRENESAIIGLLSFLLVFVVIWAVIWAVKVGMENPPPFAGGSGGAAVSGAASGVFPAGAAASGGASGALPAAAHGGGDTEIVLVYAPWCHACKSTRPIWDAWVNSAGGRVVRTAEVNGDENPEFLKAHGITHYPTVIAVRDGTKVATYSDGPLHADRLQAFAEYCTRARR